MHSNHDAQALIDSKIIKMIFKYFKGQIYLFNCVLRKLKSKTSCCLHYFGDGILGCYSHASVHSSSAAEEQRREGHHLGEERVELVD
jgi:hypothetical protein